MIPLFQIVFKESFKYELVKEELKYPSERKGRVGGRQGQTVFIPQRWDWRQQGVGLLEKPSAPSALSPSMLLYFTHCESSVRCINTS